MARVLQNTAGYLAPRVLSGLREASRDYIEHRGEIMLGLSLALRGALASTRRQGLRAFSAFGAEYAAYTAGLYALAICVGLTILAPVSLLLFFLYPTALLQVAFLIPHWAYAMAREHHSGVFEAAFLRELQAVSPAYAQRFISERESVKQGKGVWGKAGSTGGGGGHRRQRGVFSRLFSRGGVSFTLASLRNSVIGFIPLVGSLYSFLGQTTLQAWATGQDLVSPWMEEQGWSRSRQEEWVQDHKWSLVGFGLPYTLASLVPFLGGWAMVVGQAAAAHIVVQLYAPETLSSGSSSSSSSRDGGAAAGLGGLPALDIRHKLSEAQGWLLSSWQGLLLTGPAPLRALCTSILLPTGERLLDYSAGGGGMGGTQEGRLLWRALCTGQGLERYMPAQPSAPPAEPSAASSKGGAGPGVEGLGPYGVSAAGQYSHLGHLGQSQGQGQGQPTGETDKPRVDLHNERLDTGGQRLAYSSATTSASLLKKGVNSRDLPSRAGTGTTTSVTHLD